MPNLTHPAHPHLHLSTDKTHLDIPRIHRYLSTKSFWARDIPLQTVTASIANSVCIGVYDSTLPSPARPGTQIAFARWVTDGATFAWLSDVYVDDEYRGLGVGKWLTAVAVGLEEVAACRRLLLMTRGAKELYTRYGGFAKVTCELDTLEVVRDLKVLYTGGAETEVVVD